ncbi:MAG: methyltransferase domain-containing protein [Nanoarchaeota archaeon]|nr:MAG: methyltransferase domain-containing protein [Nanoarchaeota archaeon]
MSSYYDSIAKGYDELHGEEQRRKAQIILENLDVDKTDSLLDVGGGTGFATEIFPCKRIVLEPSKLREKVKGDSVEGIAENIPFGDCSFSIVVCLTAIHHFENPKKSLEEMKRVSKKYVAVSLLIKAKEFEKLDKLIRKELVGCKIFEDKHDRIYIFTT